VWFGLVFVSEPVPALGLRSGDIFTFWAGGDEGRAEFVRCLSDPARLEVTTFSTRINGDRTTIVVATFELQGSHMVPIVLDRSTQRVGGDLSWLSLNTRPTCGGIDFDPWA
jgi:hypothetical protein